MRIWVNTAVTKKYLDYSRIQRHHSSLWGWQIISSSAGRDVHNREQSVPQSSLSLAVPIANDSPFPGYWLSRAAQKGTGHSLRPHLHQRLAWLPAGTLQMSKYLLLPHQVPYSLFSLFRLKLLQPPQTSLTREKGQEGKEKEARAPIAQGEVRISKSLPISFSRGCS